MVGTQVWSQSCLIYLLKGRKFFVNEWGTTHFMVLDIWSNQVDTPQPVPHYLVRWTQNKSPRVEMAFLVAKKLADAFSMIQTGRKHIWMDQRWSVMTNGSFSLETQWFQYHMPIQSIYACATNMDLVSYRASKLFLGFMLWSLQYWWKLNTILSKI